MTTRARQAERLAMARRIAAHALCGPEKWKPGVKAGMFEDIMRGLADDEPLVRAALAAIIETTERDVNIAENWNRNPMTGAPHETSANIAAAIRAHLKGHPHAE